MKKVVNIFLMLSITGIMAIPLCLCVVYLIQQQLIEHEMIEKMELGLEKSYIFKQNEISWIKEGKELMVNNKMFDVKQFKKVGEYIQLTGLFDEEEDALLQQLAILTSHEKQPNSPLNTLLIQSFFSPSFFAPPIITVFFNQKKTIKKLYYCYNELSQTQCYRINIPPPKTAL